jgi:hypothetical protein
LARLLYGARLVNNAPARSEDEHVFTIVTVLESTVTVVLDALAVVVHLY